MLIGFVLSNYGGSPLQVGLERGLIGLGHAVEAYRRNVAFDLVLIFNQCAHRADYVYPDFPADKTPIAFIDTAEYGYYRRLPGVAVEYANTFTPAAMAHDTKNYAEQEKLRQFLQGRSFPYFIREFHNSVRFPANYHPIDYPLYALSVCHELPSREDYLRRSEDLFVSWGASHPWRWNLTHALRAHSCKKTVLVLEENGTPRMPQDQFFGRTFGAKCSVSFDGYGSGSFRVQEVLCRTLLLQGPLTIRMREPLIDGQTCVNYAINSAGENFIASDICEKLDEVLADPERSFQIYNQGYEHCNAKLTERATAQYVLKTVEEHLWHVPTELEIA